MEFNWLNVQLKIAQISKLELLKMSAIQNQFLVAVIYFSMVFSLWDTLILSEYIST